MTHMNKSERYKLVLARELVCLRRRQDNLLVAAAFLQCDTCECQSKHCMNEGNNTPILNPNKKGNDHCLGLKLILNPNNKVVITI